MPMEVFLSSHIVGPEVAEFVRKKFSNFFINNPNYTSGSYEKALIETFLEIDKLLFSNEGVEELKITYKELVESNPKAPTSILFNEGPNNKACTCNALFFKGDTMYIANAGDSRSILATKGIGIELSVDHRLENEKEITRILKAGGNVMDGRVEGDLTLTRCLGNLKYKRNQKLKPEEQIITACPDIYKHSMSQDYDFVVMGCSTIYDAMTTQQVADCIYKEMKEKPEATTSELVTHLVNTLNSGNYSRNENRDNDSLICMLIRFNKDKSN